LPALPHCSESINNPRTMRIAVATSNPKERLQGATLVVDTLGDRAVEAFLGLGRRGR